MDLKQAASYFDRQAFDTYANGEWTESTFTGQLKDSDYFVALWHRSTRRRILTVAPEQEPSAKVIRPNGMAGDVYLVGQASRDVNFGQHYRSQFPVHRAMGLAQIQRYAPTGPADNPGWDQLQVIETNYADVELRTQQDDAQTERDVHGNFYIFLPADSAVQDQDYVTLDGHTYWIEEPYIDSGFISCRTTDAPDTRANIVYRRRGEDSYEAGTITRNFTPFNVTVFPEPATKEAESKDVEVLASFIIRAGNIGFDPKLNDEIEYRGVRRRITKVWLDGLGREWHVETTA